jgi:hypothetical protein
MVDSAALLVDEVPAPSTNATMGTKCSVPITLSVCLPTSSNGPRAGHRLPRHRLAPDPIRSYFCFFLLSLSRSPKAPEFHLGLT